jgi:hypothetical protein
MGTQSAPYEPFAWWLARERIGQDLRERYAVPQEAPLRLLAPVRKLGDGLEGNQFHEETTPGAASLLKRLDAIEGNELFRACRTRMRALCCLQRSSSST